MPVSPPACVFVCVPAYPSACVSVCLSVRLIVCLSPDCLSFYTITYHFAHLFLWACLLAFLFVPLLYLNCSQRAPDVIWLDNLPKTHATKITSFVIFFSVICNLLRKIMIMIDVVTTAPKSSRVRGGTRTVTHPIWTDCTSMVHMLPMLMESTGFILKAITIH